MHMHFFEELVIWIHISYLLSLPWIFINKLKNSLTAIILVMSTLLIASTLQPSIPSAIYFIVFLCIITTWAMNYKMYHVFIGSIWFLCFVMMIHLSSIFVIQMAWLKSRINPNSTFQRFV